MAEQLGFLPEGGGSNPTSPLDLFFKPIRPENANRVFENFHYAHRAVPISWCFGAYFDGVLEGAVSFGKPASPWLCIGVCGQENANRVYELNRLWLSDRLPKNSESRFIGWALRQIANVRPPLILVSYADTGQRHIGKIYQATNWLYTGLSAEWGAELVSEGKHSRHSGEDPTAVPVVRTRKHRYVYVFNAADRAALRYPIERYPK